MSKCQFSYFFHFRKVFFFHFFLTLFVLLSALGRLQFSICFHARNIAFIFQPLYPAFFSFFLFLFSSIKVIISPIVSLQKFWPEHKLCVHSIDRYWHHSLTFLTTTSPPNTHCLLGSASPLLFGLLLVETHFIPSVFAVCLQCVSCGHWLECFPKPSSDAFQPDCVIHAPSLDCFLSLISEAKMNR